MIDLSYRARRIVADLCKQAGSEFSPEAFAKIPKRELYQYPGCGRRTWREVECWLSEHGFQMDTGRPLPVTRKEYDALFLAMTRLTDRIEKLEEGMGVFQQDIAMAARYLRSIDADRS